MHTYTPENSLLLVVSFSFISMYALSVATLLVLKAEIVATKWKRMKNIIKTKDQQTNEREIDCERERKRKRRESS